jgi:SAM-dependent methyltransferase
VIEPLAGGCSRLEMLTTFTGVLSPLMGWLERYREAFGEMETALKARAEQTPASRSPRKQNALELFEELPGRYDGLGAALSLFQDPRWRRAMVGAILARRDGRVLDVATGTGLVAEALVRRYGCRVVGIDQSPAMLERARAKLRRDAALEARIELVEGEAESLPFDDGEFDHLTFTYLLRYVDDPAATLRELARVVRPGGRVACLEGRGSGPGVSTPASRCRPSAGLPGASGGTWVVSSARASRASTRAIHSSGSSRCGATRGSPTSPCGG